MEFCCASWGSPGVCECVCVCARGGGGWSFVALNGAVQVWVWVWRGGGCLCESVGVWRGGVEGWGREVWFRCDCGCESGCGCVVVGGAYALN